VALKLSPGGGTAAEVYLPPALISPDASPDGWPGPGGEAPRPGAKEGALAAAADPRRSAPLVLAGSDLAAAGPEIATPDAVPLGAPLPAPTPQASQPSVGALTSTGLPQRIPQASLVPGAAADREARHAASAESAQIAVGRLASFQRGSRRARAVTRIERDAEQPSQDG
jgi:hypothetical protein